ncbi:DUF3307 domain-containing protein [Croceibacter atlanticus]|jgi:hypothetical protein|uniref:DUF3307 domain-containing protein n=1 Tax=Croceibacter atlanticus (strain ATCC BAA-628 / JCM 21780 / CIP 108009 / IAM 15332 / KCTC 12090 / HTCC2559) TaxID=216432 RepID=A3U938_CROAH|nr:DUF3307 domain-containing protein [Croceibacter atlanticus]EAP86324.1 hypothetical protein CA2559_09828 [Croceibacter atlanticus HTCC2559]
MDISLFLILQLIAHLLTDFVFQNNRLATDKNTKGFKSSFLIWHGLIAILLSWLLSFQLNFIIGALLIGISHYIIDGCKPFLNNHKSLGRYAFYIDQFLHIILFIAVSLTFFTLTDFNPVINVIAAKQYIVLTAGFLFILKPTNIFIKEMLSTFEIESTPQSQELEKAGRLIGILERILVVIFVLIGQFGAIGFLIAAKSILRYKDTDLLKTEYVLIGTKLSFGIAVLVGLLIQLILTL